MTNGTTQTRIELPTLAHCVSGRVGAPWITFVSGIGNDRGFWHTQAEALADDYRILTFDLWGHGQSPAPPPECTVELIVQGIAALLDRLDIDRTALVGFGFGGSVALAMALECAAQVDRVVACSCRPRQPDDRREFWRDRRRKAEEIGMARLADITVDKWLTPAFRTGHPDTDALLRRTFADTTVGGYQAALDAFIAMDFTDRLPEIAVPTLLVAGTDDHGGGPVADMTAMAVAIPDSRLAVIDGGGHLCVYDAPDVATELIAEFMKETWALTKMKHA